MADPPDDAPWTEGDPAAIPAALQRAIDRGEVVQIQRDVDAHPTWHGVPLALDDDLVLVRSLHDFALDGYAVLHLRDVTAVRAADAERFFLRVLRAEGALDAAGPAAAIPLYSWRAALEAVRARHRFAILECERARGESFFLGELAGVDAADATLHYIRVNGTRERELTRVALDELTLVRFDERYVNLFGRYAVAEDRH